MRSATQTDIAAHQSQAEGEGVVDEAVWRQCQTLIAGRHLAPPGGPGTRPEGLVKRLVAATGTGRNQWPTSLCRRIWEALMEVEPGRRRSAVHEARWLNLLGFALRPGYGLAVDDWRVAQTWTALQGKFAHASADVRVEGWILWRRIAGGLAAGQQQALADPLLGPVRSLHHQLTTGKGRSDFGFAIPETAEMWRLLGSLELLPPGHRKPSSARCSWTCCRNERWSRSAGAGLGDRPARGPGAALWAAERRRSGRGGRRLAAGRES